MPRPTTAKLARQIGKRVRQLRVEADVTQEKLAWECDLSKPYLSQVEAGKRLPSLAVLAVLARRLDVRLADMVNVEHGDPRLELLDAARRGDGDAVREALKQLGLH